LARPLITALAAAVRPTEGLPIASFLVFGAA